MARKPDAAERALWRHVTRDMRRHESAAAVVEAPPPAAPAPRPRLEPRAPAGDRAGAGLDRRSALRLRRGQMPIAARLDLHGKTQDEAHDALQHFLRRAQDEGSRAILVITGKGAREGGGVLRSAVPRWLAEPPCRAIVLAVEEAQPRHGGAGALYVLLRRKREGKLP